jgi:Outer membrane protein beta-barrel domain
MPVPKRIARGGAVCALALCALLLAAAPLQARPKGKFYLGAGVDGTRVSGDFSETQAPYAADPTNGPFVLPGKLDNGGGGTLLAGVVANDNVAIEGEILNSRNKASHELLPGVDLQARLSAVIASLRLMLPLGDSFELFGRAGLGAYVLHYDHNATLAGNPIITSSDFSGPGLALGGGLATFIDPFGFELGVTSHAIRFDKLSSLGTEGKLDPPAHMRVISTTLIVTLHFGG